MTRFYLQPAADTVGGGHFRRDFLPSTFSFLDPGAAPAPDRSFLDFAEAQLARPNGRPPHLKRWQKLGTEIVYITARKTKQEKMTRDQLEAQGLPRGTLLMRDRKGAPAAVKIERLREYRGQEPRAQWIALFDNETANVDAVVDAFPGILGVDVASLANSGSGRFESLLIARRAISPDPLGGCPYPDVARGAAPISP